MELYHLRNFVELAKDLNLRLLAERLDISQPSITRHIATLENELGLDLFVRRRGRILGLTSAGHHYLVHARAVLRIVDDAAQTAREIAMGKSGRLRLGICADTPTEKLSPILAEFRFSEPKVCFDILELPPAEQVDALRLNELDLGITRTPTSFDGLFIESLWTEAWYVAMREDHRLARLDRLTCLDLAAVDLIMAHPRRAPGGHDSIRSAFQSAGIEPCVTVHAQSKYTMIKLASQGIGVTFIIGAECITTIPGIIYRPFLIDPLEFSALFRADDPPGLAMRFLRYARTSGR